MGSNIPLAALSKRIPNVFATLLAVTTICSTTASASAPVTFTSSNGTAATLLQTVKRVPESQKLELS